MTKGSKVAGSGAGPGALTPKQGRGPANDLPGWVAPAIYALVTVLLFRKFVFSDAMLLGQDTLALGYMARDFFARSLKAGIFPFWNPLILGGTPFLESLAGGDSLYPTSVLLLVMDTHRALGWKLVVHVFLAGVFMYGWTRALGTSRLASSLAGLAYLLAPYMVTLVYPGHDGKLFVTALTPLLFWVTERLISGRTLLPFAGVSLVVGLVIMSTHFQMAYFLFGATGLYVIFRVAQVWRRRADVEEGSVGTSTGGRSQASRGLRVALARMILFLAASLVGAGAAGVQLIPAVDYVTRFSRRTVTTTEAGRNEGVQYSSSWSLHPEEVVGLVVPEFVGNDAGGARWADRTYWGRNPFKLNHEYVGVVVLLLAGLSFFGAPRRGLRGFLVGLGLLGLLYGLGSHTPVWRICYGLLPGVSLFRAPSMAIFLFGFASVTLAAFGVDRIFALAAAGDPRQWRRVFIYTAAFSGALVLLALLASSAVLGSLWTGTVYKDISPERARLLGAALPLIARGAFLAAVLTALAAGTWWALRRGLIAPTGAAALLALVIAVDLARVDDPFIQTIDVQAFAAQDVNIRTLLELRDPLAPQRLFSFLRDGQDVTPGIWGIELAAGHHPNDLGRYRELIGMVGSGAPRNLFNANVRAVLGVRWILWPESALGPLQGMERLSGTNPTTTRLTGLYEDPTGLPMARLVGSAVVVPDEEAVEVILGEDFDPARQVVLAEAPPLELDGGAPLGLVTWEERGANRARLRVRSDRNALLVVAENWYPSWQSRVDGVEVPLLRANHTLRAIPIGPGEHEVVLEYRSGILRDGFMLSASSLVLLFLISVGSLISRRRERA